MNSSRRDFLSRVTTGAAGTMMFAGAPIPVDVVAGMLRPTSAPAAPEQWDLSWVGRVKGKYRAVFDVPEVESGYGVWRASLWETQYQQVLGAKPAEMSAVVVLRHNGIALAMQQAFWDRYGVGEAKKVIHPITQQPTDRNPALLSSARGEIPATFDAVQLDRFIARGGIALACSLAFDDCVETVKAKDGVSDEQARTAALASLVPGVILQPSGVFAALRAQDAGCRYLRAS
jgi:hypothetical protein